jgi:uncharacterized membrane protein YgdD (TMEM256/DUF423 family)
MRPGLFIISILGFSAVAIGAMGAHLTDSTVLSPADLKAFDTGMNYHWYHTLAIMCVYLFELRYQRFRFELTLYAFTLGIVLFSGTIYIKTLGLSYGYDRVKHLTVLNPIGGISFMFGWLSLLIAGFRTWRDKKPV